MKDLDFVDDGQGNCIVCQIVAEYLAQDQGTTYQDELKRISANVHPNRFAPRDCENNDHANS